jgi:hypothetical protein
MKTMAKRDPGLTKIKDYSFKIPTADRAVVKPSKVSIYLNSDTGVFTISVPELIRTTLGLHDIPVSARELRDLTNAFDRIIDKYRNFILAEGRTKVIVINYLRNFPGRYSDGTLSNGFGTQPELHSNRQWEPAPSVAMAVGYEVLYQINDQIYDVPIDEITGEPFGPPNHRYAAAGKKVMNWTQEREDFFFNMREGLGAMIERVNAFFSSDYIANIDRAIAYGGSALSLPAPPPADED